MQLSAKDVNFMFGHKVLLFHSCLKLFPSKLCSHWIEPFIVTNIFKYGAVKIQSLETNKVVMTRNFMTILISYIYNFSK